MLKRHYLEQCRKYCPSLTLNDLGEPAAGIRAQAILDDGTLVMIFFFYNRTACFMFATRLHLQPLPQCRSQK